MNKRWFWIAALALVIGIAAVYGQSGSFGFLSYDDEGYTLSCPFVKDGLSLSNIASAFRDPAWGGIWMPVTYVSYMATISLFGSSPGPQHLVSVFFHCIDAVLFLLFLARLSEACGRRDPAGEGSAGRVPAAILLFSAAFWALHPLRVESVAWVASRKDTLFTLFTLLGLLAWLRAAAGRGGRACLAAAFGMMALGCMSKPTAMVFPALAFSVELLVVGRGLFASPRRWLKYAPFLALSAATAALAAYSQTHATGEASHPLFYSTFSWRVLNAAVSLGMYAYHTFIPAGLQFWYRPVRDGIPLHAAQGLASLAVAAGAFAWGFTRAGARTRLAMAASAIWFLAAISPTLGVAGSFGNHAMADRFTYVPAMGFSILLAALLSGAKASGRRGAALLGLLGLVVAGYAAAAFRYASTYRDNMAAFVNVARHDPGHCYAWTNIGSETILRTGDFDRGIAYLRKSMSVFPTDEAREQLALALATRNAPEDEAEIISICMEGLDPAEGEPIPVIPAGRDPQGFLSEALGIIAARHYDWPNAIICLETAVSRDPEREDCRMRLAMSLWNARRRGEARPHLEILSGSARPDIAAKARELLDMVTAE